MFYYCHAKCKWPYNICGNTVLHGKLCPSACQEHSGFQILCYSHCWPQFSSYCACNHYVSIHGHFPSLIDCIVHFASPLHVVLFGTTAGLLGMSVLLSQVNGLTAALGTEISYEIWITVLTIRIVMKLTEVNCQNCKGQDCIQSVSFH